MIFEAYLAFRERVEAFDPDAFVRVRETAPPANARDFAHRVAYVILNSGMRWSVTAQIWPRLLKNLQETGEVGDSFRHPMKRRDIDRVMADRDRWFAIYQALDLDDDAAVIAFCKTIPHVGDITKFHLAKNLGVDCAKPDVWVERVAAAAKEDAHVLCARLSDESGDSVALVDYVIWRACQQGWWSLDTSVSDDQIGEATGVSPNITS